MHYPSNAFAKHPDLQTMKSKDGDQQLGNSLGLTDKDTKQVQRMYKCVTKNIKKGTKIVQGERCFMHQKLLSHKVIGA